jgi:hypothetical protein
MPEIDGSTTVVAQVTYQPIKTNQDSADITA